MMQSVEHLCSPALGPVREAARAFIEEELRPLQRRLGLGSEDAWPREVLRSVWRRSFELGLLSAPLPRELGGRGLTTVDLCVLKAELARSECALSSHVLGDLSGPPRVGSLMRHATADQLERYFKPVIAGERAICFAMTEPQSGSDAGAIRTRADLRDGELIINGTKHFISGAPFADVAIVICLTDPAASPPQFSAVLVDLDLPGVQVSSDVVPISGQRIDADISFTDVRVPLANVLGGLGNGFRLGMDRINLNRLLHCPSMLGQAQRVYLRSLEYAGARQQGGAPISRFQAIQHMLADMATALWACESMILQTALLADQGADIRMQAAACKLFVSERCFEVADKAVQIHGNVGVTQHHPVEQAFRKLRMYRIVTGTSEIQRNTIARAVLESAGKG